MTYHIARGGQQIGTFAEEEVRSGLAAGRFQNGDLCWTEGMADWQPVGSKFSAPVPSFSMPPPVSSVNPYAAPQSQVLSNLPGLTPASRGSRLGACLLDGLTGIIGIGIPIIVAIFFISEMEKSGSKDFPAGAIVGFVLAGLAFLGLTVWNIVLLTTRGQTLGKKWLGIRIVTFPDGQKPGFVKGFLMRSFVNGIIGQVVPFYGIIDPCFIFREDNRCVHDLLADTTVIEGQPPEE
ncbi:MAG: RDD family protein [Verrucomicrobiaceae bacterium]|nr:RDD family protein [Verrucomicrobiaceae bacterium]